MRANGFCEELLKQGSPALIFADRLPGLLAG